jgi:hypothetical protein
MVVIEPLILNHRVSAQGGFMSTIDLPGGKVQIYQRDNSRF